MFSVKRKKHEWKNWSESVYCQPGSYIVPNSLEELQGIVQACYEQGKKIRIVGAGHSFTPLVATGDVLISLDHLSGVESIDHEKRLATVWGGTRLKELGKELFEYGWTMENLGDINAQSIAGAVSTGTHGTGCEIGNIPSQIRSLTIVKADGEMMEVSASVNKEWFNGAKIALGLFGIIVKVQLKVLPKYSLLGNSYRLSLDDCMSQLDYLKTANRNFEFYWFPYTKTVQVKTMNIYYGEAAPSNKTYGQLFNDFVMENGVFWALSEMSRLAPKTAKAVSTVSALGVPVGKEFSAGHDLYATPRLVKFQEMEYSVPAEAIKQVLYDIDHTIQKLKITVHFPIECRFVAKDNAWLSPSYQRDSAYIAVHMYKGMEFERYFNAMEEIFHYYDGRPHWGKMHSMTSHQLAEVYPKLRDFLHIRKRLDSKGIFVNDYLRELFQIAY